MQIALWPLMHRQKQENLKLYHCRQNMAVRVRTHLFCTNKMLRSISKVLQISPFLKLKNQ